MRKYAYTIRIAAVCLGIFLLLAQFTKINSLQNEVKMLKGELSIAVGHNKTLHSLAKNSLYRSVLSNDQSLGVRDFFAKQERIDTDTVLYIRIHQHDCNDCVNQALSVIHKNGTKQVVILADFPSEEALFSEFDNLRDFPVILSQSFALDIWGVTTPYAFLYDHVGERVVGVCYLHYLYIDLFDVFLKDRNDFQLGFS